MSPASAGGELLRFSGGPLQVVGFVPGRTPGPGDAAVRFAPGGRRSGGAVGAPLPAEPVVMPMENRVFLRFPRSTPPGTYRGMLTLDGAERPIEVEVEPEVFLQAVPSQLELSGAPRGRITAECELMNGGNVPVEIGRAQAFGVFDEGGIECAIGRAAVAELRPGEKRIDRFVDAVAEMHGGLVRMSVNPGKGPLQPGEARTIRLSLTVPERLKPGHAYAGNWVLHNLSYSVRITVAGGAAGAKEAHG